jgi:hypothetical protein
MGGEKILLENVKMYTKEEFSQLSTEKRERYVNSIIRKILQNAKNGISVTQLKKMTGFDRKTVEKHLGTLMAMNFGYKVSFGRVNVYYPNGRIMHPLLEENISMGDKIYSFYLLKNPYGEFIFIQEKKKTELNAIVPSGGLMINQAILPEFIECLQNSSKKIKEIERTIQSEV